MRSIGLSARRKRRFRRTTDGAHAFPVAPNLLGRDFRADAPDRAWPADLTCIWTAEGWLYLGVVPELFSHRAVGWAELLKVPRAQARGIAAEGMADHLGHELSLAALDMAIARQRPAPSLVHHSDCGVQYAVHEYRKRLGEHGMACSMSRKGNCWDNAPMESFYAILKGELVEEPQSGISPQSRRPISQRPRRP